MKIQGDWKETSITSGKWVYPNGTYWEGNFQDNKPNGVGTWHFKNGNTVRGEYSQNKFIDEEAEVPEGEEPKPIITLNWQNHHNYHNSAILVNSVEK